MNDIIYMDNAATTRLKSEVVEAMDLEDMYFNPSALYRSSASVRLEIDYARKCIADSLNTSSKNIYFTSGGTESDNWALRCVGLESGDHVITSKFEHHAILHTCDYLESQGIEVTYIDVSEDGFVNPEDVEKAIKENTKLISIMFVNNEIGTIQPIEEIGKIARKHKIIFHTDAVQAYGHLDIDVKKMKIDMLSVSAHKFGGPKGVGFLYSNQKMKPFIFGGGQENGLRSGTENVNGILGLWKAYELKDDADYVKELRDYFIKKLLDIGCVLNGSLENRICGNVNVQFPSIRGETLLYLLNEKDIYVSTGSACASKDNKPSHVLKAIGLTSDEIASSIRFSLNGDNTYEEVDYVIDVLSKYISMLA